MLEFPKWVTPHASHVIDRDGVIAVPAFPEHHVDRERNVTVLVNDEAEEAVALAEKA